MKIEMIRLFQSLTQSVREKTKFHQQAFRDVKIWISYVDHFFKDWFDLREM